MVGGAPLELTVWLRRFRCRGCRAVMTVGPPEVLRYRLYSTVAIAWALVLFGLEQLPARRVRRAISPWGHVGATAARSWQALRDWARRAGTGTLLPVRPSQLKRPREIAAAVAWSLTARSPPSFRRCSSAHQAVSGALHALMSIKP